ncbi:uncharacterized protein LOC130813392 [Amaranthus tricolor]|uniref:uncharacterized protein LOC130813392 n=1 Tax=Amaranthus tricolor TaxID=29722 RepID=UPI00258496AC|nr:uncharacterized protein LOC130813392 [Amaranthus tricolor]
MRGVFRFGTRRKLSPHFIGPYEILERVGKLAYQLALPNSLEKVHHVFHVSQLKRYLVAASLVLDPDTVELDQTLSYMEQPVCILDTKVRSTRRKDITMVKVLWANHECEAATWETETFMREKYPHLFQVSKVTGM